MTDRIKINLNNNWQFLKDDNPVENVNIPHTWNDQDGQNGAGDYYRGACTYRKNFILEEKLESKRVFLEFEGAFSVVDVSLNNRSVGRHQGGFSTFRFDITEYLNSKGDNELEVIVDNNEKEDVYPLFADFTFYGGIYRDVSILVVPDVHIDLTDYGSSGVYVSQKSVSQELAEIDIRSTIVNEGETNRSVLLSAVIKKTDGEILKRLQQTINISAGSKEKCTLNHIIKNPHLWNGKNNPYLYSVEVSLESDGKTDSITVPLGLRFFKVDPDKGFFLNGKHLSLNGVSRHQDRFDKGWAISREDQVEDMMLIKEVGATSIRLAHYQHNQYFYDLCDREGMVTWAEIPFISKISDTDPASSNAKDQLIELIRQNFNHPSIIFWGISNEITIAGGDSLPVDKELADLVKKEDPGRLSAIANLGSVEKESEFNRITDVIGYNRYDGWYYRKVEDIADWIDDTHAFLPDGSLGITEYGAEANLSLHSENPAVRDYSEEFQAAYHEKIWEILQKRPFLWGTYIWNMFDFASGFRDEGGVKGRNNKGLVTFDRKIKKDSFYFYKANWSNDPFVHIVSRRFEERAKEEIEVKVYSNCQTVSLSVNDVELDVCESVNKIFIWKDMPLEPGDNFVSAKGMENGKTVYDTLVWKRVEKPNEKYSLKVSSEKSGSNVTNWFNKNKDDLVPPEDREDIVITDDVYSTKCTLEELQSNTDTNSVLEKIFGDMEKVPALNLVKKHSVDKIAEMAQGRITDDMMYLLNRELSKIKK